MKIKFSLKETSSDAREQNETNRRLASEEREWTIECFADCPQQMNCHDCGVLCVKFECLISRRRVT
ncbi:hypothetical protein ACS0TY_017793 [Phlomoides rotata]